MRKIVKSIIGTIIEYIHDFCSMINFLIQKLNKKDEEKIRVGFFCQYIPAWEKVKPLYNKMKKDNRFQIYLLCVPSVMEKNNVAMGKNDTYQYFSEHGYEAINTVVDKGKWLDIKNLSLDYIFYPRPYNSYFPKQYNTRIVSRYTKICCVMYCMSIMKVDLDLVLNRDFCRNVYFYFAETDYIQNYMQSKFNWSYKMGMMKIPCFGMPIFDQIFLDKQKKSKSWEFSQNMFKVIWAPRWTTDKYLGGSNFFYYKDIILNYAEKHSDIDFLIRPHPMMFNNFIRTGEMTTGDVEYYKKKIQSLKNVKLDDEQEYIASMWESSVLICDISSIIPEYLMMNKPIIYCASNMVAEITEDATKLFTGCYEVHNEKELFVILENLQKGNDPLKKKREELKKWLLKGEAESASKQIVEALVCDKYNMNHK